MAEITTPALRRTISELSTEVLLYSEMLSAGAVCTRAQHNEPLLQKTEFDTSLVYQLIGNDPAVMARAAAILEERNPYGVDINMGCSAPEFLKKELGAALLGNFTNTQKIVRECRKSVKSILSVKMRTGFESNDEKLMLDFIKMFEDEGVDQIAIHPRWAKLSFRRKADRSFIKIAKQNTKIPVAGNGDVASADDAVSMMEETGCDAVMIGREAVRSPWIFALSSKKLKGETSPLEINIEKIFVDTLSYIMLYLPENLQKSRAHRFCAYFSKNAKFGHQLFTKIRHIDKIDDMIYGVRDYYSRNREESVIKITP